VNGSPRCGGPNSACHLHAGVDRKTRGCRRRTTGTWSTLTGKPTRDHLIAPGSALNRRRSGIGHRRSAKMGGPATAESRSACVLLCSTGKGSCAGRGHECISRRRDAGMPWTPTPWALRRDGGSTSRLTPSSVGLIRPPAGPTYAPPKAPHVGGEGWPRRCVAEDGAAQDTAAYNLYGQTKIRLRALSARRGWRFAPGVGRPRAKPAGGVCYSVANQASASAPQGRHSDRTKATNCGRCRSGCG